MVMVTVACIQSSKQELDGAECCVMLHMYS